MKLSVCMITKNEQRCIERCLKSCAGAVDEIIMVDTGSTDETVNIAKRLGVRVLHFTWQNNFSLARNFALQHASGDWILSLDADEYFARGEAKKLKTFVEKISRQNPDVDCISVRQYQLDASGKTDEFVGKEILFKNNAGIEFEGVIHEHLMKKNASLKVMAAPPGEVSFLHDGYIGALNREKSLRNMKLLQEELKKNSEDAMLYNYMAQSSFPLRDYEGVLRYSLEFLNRVQKPSAHVLRALLWCQEALRMLPLPKEEAKNRREYIKEKALRLFEKHPTAYLIAGNAAFELGDGQKALAYYERADVLRDDCTQSEDEYFSINLQNDAWPGIYTRLGQLFSQKGENDKAQRFYLKALNENPNITAAVQGYVKCGGEIKSKVLAEQLLGLQTKACDKKMYVHAVRDYRCDLCYLIVYDEWLKQNPQRDEYFTTMQIMVAQTDAAVLDTVAKLTHHPLWCGSFGRTAELLCASEINSLLQTLAEAVCGALMAHSTQYLRMLLPVCPAPLATAIKLCVGDEVDVFPEGYRDILQLCARRLVALGAGSEIIALWGEVLKLAV